ncbi:SpoIIE family protein phosphatase [uncultured Microscilla sp.]|uniref:GAF domain-containing SpoIIE family protein phosphatase n=1 Tax=uncultured Microscilla sp. TaxID=432653 RepID=UPI0026138F56|nr:SpoIIE family protein phosphatase [uncultured Microscilla sp.]
MSNNNIVSVQPDVSAYNGKDYAPNAFQMDVSNLEESENSFDDWLRLHTSRDVVSFTNEVLEYLAETTQAFRAVFFVQTRDNHKKFEATACYGVSDSVLYLKTVTLNEGIIGEVAATKKAKIFNNLPKNALTIDFVSVGVSTACVLVLPVLFNNTVYGVVELYYFRVMTAQEQKRIKRLINVLGATLQGILDYRKNKILLEQSDEHREQILAQKDEMEQTIEKLFDTQVELEKQKKRTEIAFNNFKSTNKRLMESIKYAKSVQKALLPDPLRLNTLFSESFVVYQPKDVVSGDFYWFSKADFTQAPPEPFILAVIDCTGHGVPGGFMSMVGNALLHEIVNIKQIIEPALILTMLHRGIRDVLRQESSTNHDGMEATICQFLPKNEQEYDVIFAGAKHQLYYFKDDKMLKVSGDRKFLGGGNLQLPHLTFENHTFSLKKGEVLYLSTDGLVDTCNPQRRKYGTKRWESIVKGCYQKPLSTQKHIIIKDVLNFKQDGEQRDDITCISVRV